MSLSCAIAAVGDWIHRRRLRSRSQRAARSYGQAAHWLETNGREPELARLLRVEARREVARNASRRIRAELGRS